MSALIEAAPGAKFALARALSRGAAPTVPGRADGPLEPIGGTYLGDGSPQLAAALQRRYPALKIKALYTGNPNDGAHEHTIAYDPDTGISHDARGTFPSTAQAFAGFGAGGDRKVTRDESASAVQDPEADDYVERNWGPLENGSGQFGDLQLAPASDDDDLDALLDSEPEPAAERELDEALLVLIESIFDEAAHPRWPPGSHSPSGKNISGQWMRIGERFMKDGHEWEIEHVAKGHVIAHESSGKFNQAQTRVFSPTQASDGTNVIADAKPVEIPILKAGQGASYSEVERVPVVPAGAENDHDPTIHLPAGSPLTQDEWQNFGKADQLLYTALSERFGAWKSGFAKGKIPQIMKSYSAVAQSAVRSAFKNQYSSGYGKKAGDFLSLQRVFDEHPSAQARQIYQEGRELQGDIEEVNAWELYNRLHAPDVAVFHGGGGGTHNDKIVSGTGALKPGYSTSWAHSKGANWGPSITAFSLAARHVLLASDISAPPGAETYMGEAEFSTGDRLLLNPQIAHNYKHSSLDTGLASWVNSSFSYSKGAMQPGGMVQAMIDHMKGGTTLPIPPPPPNVQFDAKGAGKPNIPDASIITQAAALAKDAGYANNDTAEEALKEVSGLDLKPGDLIEGHTIGKRYLVISSPGAPSGLSYMKLDGSNAVFNFSQTSERRKLDKHVEIPPPPEAEKLAPFNPDHWVQAGQLQALGQMNEGDKVALEGSFYEVTGQAGSQTLLKSLTTGETAHANAGAVTAALGPKPGFEEPYHPTVGEQVVVDGKLVATVLSTSDEAAQVRLPDGKTIIAKHQFLSAAPQLPKVKASKGDTFSHDGQKMTVTHVYKDGTVSAKPLGGNVQKFAPGDLPPDVFRPGDYQPGEKAKLGSMEPGALINHSTGKKIEPYQVLGTTGTQTHLKNLGTGEIVALSKNKSYPKLLPTADIPKPGHADWKPGDEVDVNSLQPGDKIKWGPSGKELTFLGPTTINGKPGWKYQHPGGQPGEVPASLVDDIPAIYLGKAEPTPTPPAQALIPNDEQLSLAKLNLQAGDKFTYANQQWTVDTPASDDTGNLSAYTADNQYKTFESFAVPTHFQKAEAGEPSVEQKLGPKTTQMLQDYAAGKPGVYGDWSVKKTTEDGTALYYKDKPVAWQAKSGEHFTTQAELPAAQQVIVSQIETDHPGYHSVPQSVLTSIPLVEPEKGLPAGVINGPSQSSLPAGMVKNDIPLTSLPVGTVYAKPNNAVPGSWFVKKTDGTWEQEPALFTPPYIWKGDESAAPAPSKPTGAGTTPGLGIHPAMSVVKGHHMKIKTDGKGAEYVVLETPKPGDKTLSVQVIKKNGELGNVYPWKHYGKNVLITKEAPAPAASSLTPNDGDQSIAELGLAKGDLIGDGGNTFKILSTSKFNVQAENVDTGMSAPMHKGFVPTHYQKLSPPTPTHTDANGTTLAPGDTVSIYGTPGFTYQGPDPDEPTKALVSDPNAPDDAPMQVNTANLEKGVPAPPPEPPSAPIPSSAPQSMGDLNVGDKYTFPGVTEGYGYEVVGKGPEGVTIKSVHDGIVETLPSDSPFTSTAIVTHKQPVPTVSGTAPGEMPHVADLPIQPYLWPKSGSNSYDTIESLKPGEQFMDKAGNKHTVVSHNVKKLEDATGTTTVAGPNGGTFEVPHKFVNAKGKTIPTRVFKLSTVADVPNPQDDEHKSNAMNAANDYLDSIGHSWESTKQLHDEALANYNSKKYPAGWSPAAKWGQSYADAYVDTNGEGAESIDTGNELFSAVKDSVNAGTPGWTPPEQKQSPWKQPGEVTGEEADDALTTAMTKGFTLSGDAHGWILSKNPSGTYGATAPDGTVHTGLTSNQVYDWMVKGTDPATKKQWADLRVGDVVKAGSTTSPFKITADHGDHWEVTSTSDGSKTDIPKTSSLAFEVTGHEHVEPNAASIAQSYLKGLGVGKWAGPNWGLSDINGNKVWTYKTGDGQLAIGYMDPQGGVHLTPTTFKPEINDVVQAIKQQHPDYITAASHMDLENEAGLTPKTPDVGKPTLPTAEVEAIPPWDAKTKPIIDAADKWLLDNGVPSKTANWIHGQAAEYKTNNPSASWGDAYKAATPQFATSADTHGLKDAVDQAQVPSEPIIEKTPPAAPKPGPGEMPDYTGTVLTTKGSAGGTTGAQLATDPSGKQWLIKGYGGNRDRVATELLANSIYRTLGVKAADAGTWKQGDQTRLAYPLVDGNPTQFSTKYGSGDVTKMQALGDGYMTDALLANYDFVGLDDDNVLWNGNEPTRIDQGGTFEYRAQGQPKPFGPVPTEVASMLDKGQGKRGVIVSESSMRKQAGEIADTLTPQKIDQLVDAAPFKDQKMRERYRENLKARVTWMAQFANGEHSNMLLGLNLAPDPPSAKPSVSAPPTPQGASEFDPAAMTDEHKKAFSAAQGWLSAQGLPLGTIAKIHGSAIDYHAKGSDWPTSYVHATGDKAADILDNKHSGVRDPIEKALAPPAPPPASKTTTWANLHVGDSIAVNKAEPTHKVTADLGDQWEITHTDTGLSSKVDKTAPNPVKLFGGAAPAPMNVSDLKVGDHYKLSDGSEYEVTASEPGYVEVKNLASGKTGAFLPGHTILGALKTADAKPQFTPEPTGAPTAPYEEDMPIKPYLWPKGGKKTFTAIASLKPGATFTDKNGDKYRVVATAAGGVTVAEPVNGGASFAVPHSFVNKKTGKVHPTRVSVS